MIDHRRCLPGRAVAGARGIQRRPLHTAATRVSAVTGPAAHAGHASAATGDPTEPAVDTTGPTDGPVRPGHAAAATRPTARPAIGAAGPALAVEATAATRVEWHELDGRDAARLRARHLGGCICCRKRCGGNGCRNGTREDHRCDATLDPGSYVELTHVFGVSRLSELETRIPIRVLVSSGSVVARIPGAAIQTPI